MKAREAIAILEADGWYRVKSNSGGHKQYKHDEKPGKVTVSMHPGDLTMTNIKGIELQSGLKLRHPEVKKEEPEE